MPGGILLDLIEYVAAIVIAYGVNFIGCDLIYHDFDVSQALKGSYWFILGPFLYIFGTTIPWVAGLIKVLFLKVERELKDLFSGWWDDHDPFKAIGLDSTPTVNRYLAEPFFSEESIGKMQDNVSYLKSIGRYSSIKRY